MAEIHELMGPDPDRDDGYERNDPQPIERYTVLVGENVRLASFDHYRDAEAYADMLLTHNPQSAVSIERPDGAVETSRLVADSTGRPFVGHGAVGGVEARTEDEEPPAAVTYTVKDRHGNLLRTFGSWDEAERFANRSADLNPYEARIVEGGGTSQTIGPRQNRVSPKRTSLAGGELRGSSAYLARTHGTKLDWIVQDLEALDDAIRAICSDGEVRGIPRDMLVTASQEIRRAIPKLKNATKLAS